MPGEACEILPMTHADRDLVFAWRNLPEIVALSGSGRTVSRDEHVAWFARALQDEACLMWKIVVREEPVGQVRFDVCRETGARAVVTIFLLPAWSGRGMGRIAFRKALSALAARRPGVDVVVADVVADNAGAMRFFASLGFVPIGTCDAVDGRTLTRLERPCRGSGSLDVEVP